MPYIIVVNQPGYLPEQDPYAVATLDEARAAVHHEIDLASSNEPDADDAAALDALAVESRSLDEAGGIIGPLPDGYVIDVRRVSWPELYHLAGHPSKPGTLNSTEAEVIDAYNQA